MRCEDKEELFNLLNAISSIQDQNSNWSVDDNIKQQIEITKNNIKRIRYRCNHYGTASPLSVPQCRFILAEVTDNYRVYKCADCHRSIKVLIDKPNIEDMVEKCHIIKSYIDSMILQMSSLTSGEYFDSNMMKELSITMSVLDELPKIYGDIHEKFHKHR